MPREQQVSRKVSWLLRHGAGQEGLKLGKGGYVSVDEALNTQSLRKLQVTFPELREVVRTNDKKRFSMVLKERLEKIGEEEAEKGAAEDEEDISNAGEEDEDASKWMIRANQGHSIKVDTEGLLTPITLEAGNIPNTVVHGTDEPAWNLILKSGGLRRMGRNHIHFASGLPAGFRSLSSSSPATEQEKEAPPVISGMRKSSTVLVYIDTKAALQAGVKFFISENGVILTEGNDEGFLSYQYFKSVENRKNGSVLMSEGVLPEGAVVDMEAWEKEVGGRGGKGGRGRGGRGGRGGKGGRGGRDGGGKARANDDSGDLMAGV